MEAQGSPGISACGLDCEKCPIRRIPEGGAAAEPAVAWYRKMGWLRDDEGAAEAFARKMYCRGCFGSREEHWSADCWILKCCVDERKLRHCSECGEFACAKLEEWGRSDAAYGTALERLRGMHAAGG